GPEGLLGVGDIDTRRRLFEGYDTRQSAGKKGKAEREEDQGRAIDLSRVGADEDGAPEVRSRPGD
ncbi:MAG TPA: hypothetical protein P5308_08625, partial [Syntrophales bacterium]|nr:hypothetical protein [Syntrophales bacterium]